MPCTDSSILCWLDRHAGLAGYLQAVGTVVAVIASGLIARRGIHEQRFSQWRSERGFLRNVERAVRETCAAAGDLAQLVSEGDPSNIIANAYKPSAHLMFKINKNYDLIQLNRDKLVDARENESTFPESKVRSLLHLIISPADRIIEFYKHVNGFSSANLENLSKDKETLMTLVDQIKFVAKLLHEHSHTVHEIIEAEMRKIS